MKKLSYLFLILISIILFTLTMRGTLGNPSVEEIEKSHISNRGAFESSQESSRYAMILSVVNDRRIDLNKYPFLGTPDLGYINGSFFSFFPPTLSVLAIPFYILGLNINAAQIAVFSMPAVFSLLTMMLIFKITQKLELHWSIGIFSAIAFGFATNAWGYSVTLYAHVVSAFLLLLAIYITCFWREKFNYVRLIIFWFIYGLAIYLDYPNLFAFLPVALAITFQGINFEDQENKFKLSFNISYFVAPLVFLVMLLGLGFYNNYYFGSPLQISNSIPRVNDINKIAEKTTEAAKGSVPALQTRNLLEGLHSFSISLDRGILIYSPVVLLSIFAFIKSRNKNTYFKALVIAVTGINLLQYSMFGDPYGGWAFGSRYMIVVLPGLCILLGTGLSRFTKNIFVKILYTLVFAYSTAVSLLAPLTTNVIPPFVEARTNNLDYTYILNIKRLLAGDLSSFFYNQIINKTIPGIYYYIIIFGLIFLTGTTLIWWRRKNEA